MTDLPEEIEMPLFAATVSGAGIAPLVTGAALLDGLPILHALALFPATIIVFALMGGWCGFVIHLLVRLGGL